MCSCFSSKKQKANFIDEEPSKITASAPTTSQHEPTSQTPSTTESSEKKMAPPKVAIIIYSMYGHIASSTHLPIFHFVSKSLTPH